MAPSKNALSAPSHKLEDNLQNLSVMNQLNQLCRYILKISFFSSCVKNYCGLSDFKIFTSSSLQKIYGFI